MLNWYAFACGAIIGIMMFVFLKISTQDKERK